MRDRQGVVEKWETRALLRIPLEVVREEVDDVEALGAHAVPGQHLLHQADVVGNCMSYVDVALVPDEPHHGGLHSLARIAQHAAIREVFPPIGKLAELALNLHC